jgi:hypothetical protein
LNDQSAAIGAETSWTGSNQVIFNNLFNIGSCDHNSYALHILTGHTLTGDALRTSLQFLQRVINAGIGTVIYTGDAQYTSSNQNVENMVNAIKSKDSSQYGSTPWTSWTVDGVTAGQLKNAGNFSYVQSSGGYSI